MIKSGIGKDATAMFNGGVYNHSNAAHNLLSTMRVGVIRGGMEVEIWKRSHADNKDTIMVKDSDGNRGDDHTSCVARKTSTIAPPPPDQCPPWTWSLGPLDRTQNLLISRPNALD